jgi:acylphosphatase
MNDSESGAVRAHVFISGRVQGVFFRDSTAKAARSEGVAGWVRNLRDGRVEACFEGNRQAVESMIAWCNSGPRHADVDDVNVEWEPAQGEKGFRVR